MSNIDNTYRQYFGMKSQTNEADLINKISDYKGGFLYKLIDPATAGNVKADIQAFLNKKGMHVIKTKFDDAAGKGFFYVRLGEDPAKESQRIQGFVSQLPEVAKFKFTLKPIQKVTNNPSDEQTTQIP
jgi:hypothetical protein